MEHTGAIAVGQLLVATEPGRGGFFDRTVILLISHNESGTIGLCLNLRPDDEATPGSPLAQVRAHFGELLSPPGEVMIGGPVNPEVVVLLGEPVSAEQPPPGWERVLGEVGVVDVNFPRELLETSFAQLRVFSGLSGWAPGQLEGELLRGSWFRTRASATDVFGEPSGLWRRVLRRMGGATGRWSTWTDEPRLN